MKISLQPSAFVPDVFAWSARTCPRFATRRHVASLKSGDLSPHSQTGRQIAAFTMIEIAICLAIIGFALVAIIGVLPIGMNTQRDVREETIINQDATVLLEAIRSGARGVDSLTNYVYAITNAWVWFNTNGSVKDSGVNGFTFANASLDGVSRPVLALTNGANIIGQLSVPEFAAWPGGPAIVNPFGVSYVSNYVRAYVRAISGLAAEKPPQDNPIMREGNFTYRLLCVNAPMPVATNVYDLPAAQRQYLLNLAANQRELRLTFFWPQRPSGSLGPGRQTFRATIAGQLNPVDYHNLGNSDDYLYFYQSQSFTNAP